MIVGCAEELIASFEGTDYIGVVLHHVITRYCEDLFSEEYGEILDFTHVFKDEDPWFDMVKWLPAEPAKLINP